MRLLTVAAGTAALVAATLGVPTLGATTPAVAAPTYDEVAAPAKAAKGPKLSQLLMSRRSEDCDRREVS